MEIVINNLEEMKQYYDEVRNTYVFKKGGEYPDYVIFNFDVSVGANIDANDILANDITAINIKARNIKAHKIYCSNLRASVTHAYKIKARSIKSAIIDVAFLETNVLECCGLKADNVMIGK